jgi:hypothetical protein
MGVLRRQIWDKFTSDRAVYVALLYGTGPPTPLNLFTTQYFAKHFICGD